MSVDYALPSYEPLYEQGLVAVHLRTPGVLIPYLSAARYRQGLLLGKMQEFGYQLKKEATLLALTEETVKSSAIEGEELNPESVRSSLPARLKDA